MYLLKDDPDRARQHFEHTVNLDSRHRDALTCLGILLQKRNKPLDALEHFERVLRLEARTIEAWLGKGKCLIDLGRHGEAVRTFDAVISAHPTHAEAWVGRGNALRKLKSYEACMAAYERALAIDPRCVDAWAARGHALTDMQRYDEALLAYDSALANNGDCVEAWLARGSTLLLRRDFESALGSFDKALALRPDLPAALMGRCEALYGVGQYEEQTYAKLLAVELGDREPRDKAQWLYDRAILLLRVGRVAEAIPDLRKATAIDPDAKLALGHLVNARMRLCDWHGLDDDCDRLIAAVRAGKWVCEPFSFLAVPADAADQLQCAKTHAGNQAAVVAHSGPQKERSSGHERVRVAYVSADFREHPVAFLMAGLFERHDRGRFETFAISLRRDDSSEMQKRIRGAFDQFLDVSAMDDRDAAALLRANEIDIAVDLMGYTQNARPGIFAWRAAPIQVIHLGYQGTTGAEHMDYVIADRIVLPPDQQACYSEKIVRLPDCYMVNDSQRAISSRAPDRVEEGLPGNGFVFCCFNQSYKLLPATFDIWMRLLARVEASVLWLSALNATAAGNLRAQAQARGIDPARLIFARRVASVADHLARQRLADLFLDTLPYNAHSTASDALWAGLPVLTCLGRTFAGRAAASLLHAVGLPELVTDSPGEYEALARKLALEPAALLALRSKLAANRLTHPLFDTDRFRRHIEAAYRTMWEIRQRGEPPRPFGVAPL